MKKFVNILAIVVIVCVDIMNPFIYADSEDFIEMMLSDDGAEDTGESEETLEDAEETSEDAEETSEDAEETSEDAEETSEDEEETSEDEEEASEDGEETSEDEEEASEDEEEVSEDEEEASEDEEEVSENEEQTSEDVDETSENEEETQENEEEVSENKGETSENEGEIPENEILDNNKENSDDNAENIDKGDDGVVEENSQGDVQHSTQSSSNIGENTEGENSEEIVSENVDSEETSDTTQGQGDLKDDTENNAEDNTEDTQTEKVEQTVQQPKQNNEAKRMAELAQAWKILNSDEMQWEDSLAYVIIKAIAATKSLPNGVDLRIKAISDDEETLEKMDEEEKAEIIKQLEGIRNELAEQYNVSQESEFQVFDISYIYTVSDGTDMVINPLEEMPGSISFNYTYNDSLMDEENTVALYYLKEIGTDSDGNKLYETGDVVLDTDKTVLGEIVAQMDKSGIYILVSQPNDDIVTYTENKKTPEITENQQTKDEEVIPKQNENVDTNEEINQTDNLTDNENSEKTDIQKKEEINCVEHYHLNGNKCEKDTYIITWKNEDGTVRDITVVEYGQMPIHADAFQSADAQFSYVFSGWNPEISIAIEDAEYVAQYKYELNKYTVKWLDENGNTLEEDKDVPYGEQPSFDGKEPTKEGTPEFSYSFEGWEPEVSEVKGDVIYKAKYSEKKNSYTITWKNEDGTVIDTTLVEYGQIPTHEDVSKPNDEQSLYNFIGWEPEIVAVTGDAEYVTKYDNGTKETAEASSTQNSETSDSEGGQENESELQGDDQNIIDLEEGNSDSIQTGDTESKILPTAAELIQQIIAEIKGTIEEEKVAQMAQELEQARKTTNEQPITGHDSYKNIVVNVSAPKNSFPEGTELRISPITTKSEIQTIKNQIKESTDIQESIEFISFDISFIYTFSGGEEIELQPAEGKSVQVTFDYSDNTKLQNAEKVNYLKIEVYHINDKDENGNKVSEGEERVEKLEINEAKSEEVGKGIVIEANSFSPFVLMATSQGTRNIEIPDCSGSFYTVILSGDSGISGFSINGSTYNGEVTRECGTEIPVEAIPKPGYHFRRWEERKVEDEEEEEGNE